MIGEGVTGEGGGGSESGDAEGGNGGGGGRDDGGGSRRRCEGDEGKVWEWERAELCCRLCRKQDIMYNYVVSK